MTDEEAHGIIWDSEDWDEDFDVLIFMFPPRDEEEVIEPEWSEN